MASIAWDTVRFSGGLNNYFSISITNLINNNMEAINKHRIMELVS